MPKLSPAGDRAAIEAELSPEQQNGLYAVCTGMNIELDGWQLTPLQQIYESLAVENLARRIERAEKVATRTARRRAAQRLGVVVDTTRDRLEQWPLMSRGRRRRRVVPTPTLPTEPPAVSTSHMDVNELRQRAYELIDSERDVKYQIGLAILRGEDPEPLRALRRAIREQIGETHQALLAAHDEGIAERDREDSAMNALHSLIAAGGTTAIAKLLEPELVALGEKYPELCNEKGVRRVGAVLANQLCRQLYDKFERFIDEQVALGVAQLEKEADA